MTNTDSPQRSASGRARSASGRALSMAALADLMGLMTTPAGIARGLAFKLRPTDIVITPFGKSGTTWLQQIAHTLRTRGDMDFDDISRVVPWLEVSTDLGIDLDAEQRANPRLFKSHLDAQRVPQGGRYINACRNPRDVVFSMYKFMEGWFLEPGAVSPDDFALGKAIGRGLSPDKEQGDYWTHLLSWWARRQDADVLFLAYEHMQRDLSATIQRVAEFMGIELDAELLAITEEHASLAFMQRHRDRFDDKLMRERSVTVAGLPADSDSSKVRTGQVGESGRYLSPQVIAQLDAIWQQRITPVLGFQSYEEMIAVL